MYEVWKEIDEQNKYVPKIQTKRTTVNMRWFEQHKGFSDIATNSDFVTGMQEERCDDVDGVNDQFSAVHISLESYMTATETVLKQLPIPLTQAKQLLPLMEAVFGYSSFQLKQEQAIDSSLKKKNTFVVMPTGGGKSIIYLLPALAQHGISIIISPLRSLIEDQISRCTSLGIGSAFIVGND